MLEFILIDFIERFNLELIQSNQSNQLIRNIKNNDLSLNETNINRSLPLDNINRWLSIRKQNQILNLFGVTKIKTHSSTLNEEYRDYHKNGLLNSILCYLIIPDNNPDTITLQNLFLYETRNQQLVEENYVYSERFTQNIYNIETRLLWETSQYLYIPIQNRLFLERTQQNLREQRNTKKILVPVDLNVNDYIHPNSSQKNSKTININYYRYLGMEDLVVLMEVIIYLGVDTEMIGIQ